MDRFQKCPSQVGIDMTFRIYWSRQRELVTKCLSFVNQNIGMVLRAVVGEEFEESEGAVVGEEARALKLLQGMGRASERVLCDLCPCELGILHYIRFLLSGK